MGIKETEDTTELWYDLIGYEGYYQISNYGRVKALSRIAHKEGTKGRLLPEFIIKQVLGKRGYYVVGLRSTDKTNKTKTVHRLIAIQFIPNPDNKPHVNHIDGNPLNNAIDNLEWTDNRENASHGRSTKNKTSGYIGVGWDKWAGKWKSQIYYKGKSIHLGHFVNELDAYEARLKFERDNGISNKYINKVEATTFTPSDDFRLNKLIRQREEYKETRVKVHFKYDGLPMCNVVSVGDYELVLSNDITEVTCRRCIKSAKLKDNE
jgi:hypothetical protein